jgi:hypothetical protein
MRPNGEKTEIIYRKMLTGKTGKERLMMGFSMFDFSSRILLSSLRKKVAPEKLRKAVFLRLYRNDFSKSQQEKILKHL